MTMAIRTIAAVYGILGGVMLLQTLDDSTTLTPGEATAQVLVGLFVAGLARGLVNLRQWARLIALGISAMTGMMGLVCLYAWLQAWSEGLLGVRGFHFERPVLILAFTIFALVFSAFQWGVLAPERARRRFHREPAGIRR